MPISRLGYNFDPEIEMRASGSVMKKLCRATPITFSLQLTNFHLFGCCFNRCSKKGCFCCSKHHAICCSNRGPFLLKSFFSVPEQYCNIPVCFSGHHQLRENVPCCPCAKKSSTRCHRVKSAAWRDSKTREESSLPLDDLDRCFTDLLGSFMVIKSV